MSYQDLTEAGSSAVLEPRDTASQTALIFSPLEAAWRAGQLLNQYFFWLVQAWLTSDAEAFSRANATIDPLAVILRNIPSGPADRNRIRELVLKLRRDWRAAFAEEWRMESEESAYIWYTESAAWRDPDANLSQAMSDILAPVITAMDDILAELTLFFSPEQLRVFELARLVDQGVRPAAIWQELDRRQGAFLPSGFREQCSRVPEGWWLREIEQRWHDLNLPMQRLPARPRDDAAGVRRFCREISEVAMACLAGNVSERDDPATQPDTNPDMPQRHFIRLPRNLDILRLARMLREKKDGTPDIEVAKELTDGDARKAENLLRGLRRFPQLRP